MSNVATPVPPTLEELEEYIAGDPCARDLGLHWQRDHDDNAVLCVTIDGSLINGLGVCHGGVLFLLADTALAYAARMRGGMHASTWGTVSYLRPARLGDTIFAYTRLIESSSKRAHFDVDLFTDQGEHIAIFRGQSVRVDPAKLADRS